MILTIFNHIDLFLSGVQGVMTVEFNGEKYVTKEDVSTKLIPSLSKNALRSLMSRHQMKTVLAKGITRSRLDKTLGSRKGGHYLVKVSDVQVILKMRAETTTTTTAQKLQRAEETTTKQPVCLQTPRFKLVSSPQNTINYDFSEVTAMMEFCREIARTSNSQADIELSTFATPATAVAATAEPGDEPRRQLETIPDYDDTTISVGGKEAQICCPPARTPGQSVDTAASMSTASATITIAPAHEEIQATREDTVSVCVSVSAERKVDTPVQDEEQIPVQNCQGHNEKTTTKVTVEPEIVPKKRERRSKPIQLEESLETQLEQLYRFYTKILNPQRPSVHMAESTVRRHMKHIREFLTFVTAEHKRPARFEDTLLIKLVSRYLDVRTEGLSKGTAANHVQSLIVLAKYTLRDSNCQGRWDTVDEISQLRHLQSQLQVRYIRLFVYLLIVDLSKLNLDL